MSTETFARATAALLAELDLKAKRQIIAEDEKARVRFLQERKVGHQTAKETLIDAWLREAMKVDFALRQKLFHAWLQKANLPNIPNFDELACDEDTKGKRAKTFPSDTKASNALKKLLKSWLEEADSQKVEIYTYLGPYEFPEKSLVVIPEAEPESSVDETSSESAGVSQAAFDSLQAEKAEFEKQLSKERAELAKIKKLLDAAKDKREADLAKAEESWRREKEQLLARLADTSLSAKKLQEEISAKAQPISQLKRDLEDSLRYSEKLLKELTDAKGVMEQASKQRDEAINKRQVIEVE
ncbi:MAG: hypothetical protein HY692_05720, partial [Cyanobacteria bacterium NC_groundwater_1444_Ag_S-0.65um_54_12]|nr:hypothetical protein [Cyanobacteria bacterium NC_groundwater_1444_Ag_S-0.65um_54_12]